MPVKYISDNEHFLVSDENNDEKMVDDLVNYLNECEDEEIEPAKEAELMDGVIMQFNIADYIITNEIESICENEDIPADWDYNDVKDRLVGLDEFRDKLKNLIKEFNDKQTVQYYIGSGVVKDIENILGENKEEINIPKIEVKQIPDVIIEEEQAEIKNKIYNDIINKLSNKTKKEIETIFKDCDNGRNK